jgi:hypothetical protein
LETPVTCPKCHSTIDVNDKLCPDCGTGLYRNVSGIIRTSAVMISADGEDRFFHSVQEVPERLRKRLIDTTAGDNSGIIVIADRAGKEQLTQALTRRAEARQQPARPFTDCPLPEAPAPMPEAEPTAQTRLARLPWIAWAGFFAVLAGAAAISAFFSTRW